VLFDAKLNGGVLDWTDVISKIDIQGPLLVLARTDKGYVAMHDTREGSLTHQQQRVWRVPGGAVLPHWVVAQRQKIFRL
jgi:hypothetical protein